MAVVHECSLVRLKKSPHEEFIDGSDLCLMMFAYICSLIAVRTLDFISSASYKLELEVAFSFSRIPARVTIGPTRGLVNLQLSSREFPLVTQRGSNCNALSTVQIQYHVHTEHNESKESIKVVLVSKLAKKRVCVLLAGWERTRWSVSDILTSVGLPG